MSRAETPPADVDLPDGVEGPSLVDDGFAPSAKALQAQPDIASFRELLDRLRVIQSTGSAVHQLRVNLYRRKKYFINNQNASK